MEVYLEISLKVLDHLPLDRSVLYMLAVLIVSGNGESDNFFYLLPLAAGNLCHFGGQVV